MKSREGVKKLVTAQGCQISRWDDLYSVSSQDGYELIDWMTLEELTSEVEAGTLELLIRERKQRQILSEGMNNGY